MAVCARGSVLVFYAVFAAGFFSTFWENKNVKKSMGRAVFQGRAQMITTDFFYMALFRKIKKGNTFCCSHVGLHHPSSLRADFHPTQYIHHVCTYRLETTFTAYKPKVHRRTEYQMVRIITDVPNYTQPCMGLKSPKRKPLL